MTSRNNSPNDARSLNDMLEKEAYEKGSKHDVNTAAFHRQWTPKNAAHSGSNNSSYKTGRTHPPLRTYHLAKPTRKPTTPQDRSRLHNVLRGRAHRTTSGRCVCGLLLFPRRVCISEKFSVIT